MSALVECAGVSFAYRDRAVLDGVDLRLAAGEFVALIGPNGAGKSTLLHALLGILTPASGEVHIGGQPRNGLSRREVALRVAFVPQETPSDFAFTVRELVAMGRTPHLGRFQPERPADLEAVERALDAAGLTDFADRAVSELSGGERQRVHVARAIAQETPALLLDEPTSNLDLEHQLEVLDVVRALVREGSPRRGALVALHDLTLAARYADRVVMLAGGRVVLSGPPRDVITEESLARWFHIRARVFSTSELPGERDTRPDRAGLVLVPEGRTR